MKQQTKVHLSKTLRKIHAKTVMRDFYFISEVQVYRIKLELHQKFNIMNRERQIELCKVRSMVEANRVGLILRKGAPT